MKQSNSSLDVDVWLVFAFVVVAFVSKYVIPSFIEIKNQVISFFYVIIKSKTFYFTLGGIALILFSFLNYKFISFIVKERKENKERREFIKNESREIDKIIKSYDLNSITKSSEANESISLFKEKSKVINSYYELSFFDDTIDKILKDLIKKKEILIFRERVNELRHEEYQIKENIKELEREEQKRIDMLERSGEKALQDLHPNENPVFVRKNLNSRQEKLLLGVGYSYTNEFCVDQQKMISVLVKPTLNHSKTHTFLVWSVMKLLNKMKEISHVKDYDTREADITFKANDEDYAVEVETGTLLGKKQQLTQKIDYLDKKYKDRWMILVSHRKLLSKYKKFGLVTSRKDFSKNLKKLLKN